LGSDLPLGGLRVVDFSRLLPGPYASLWLADLGADVIKVEEPKGGDYLRWMPPLAGGLSYAFNALNSGKRSLAIDLKQPAGAQLMREVLLKADVVLESFRPGVMSRLGLGYPELAEPNPGLIYCAITGYGTTGPYVDRAGHDLNYLALAGVLGVTGPVDRPPSLSAVQIADIGGGALQALTGILAALVARASTGRGRFLDVSMTDGSLGFLQVALAAHLGSGARPPARGADTLSGGQACYAVYETSDGRYMALAALEPKFWVEFCRAVERPDLLARHFGGPAEAARTRQELAALFLTRTRVDWEACFAGVDACCEPVLEAAEVATHPLHVARANVIRDARGVVRLRTPLRPVDAPPPGAAPGLGASSRAVLEEIGVDPERIARLAADRVIVVG
jgi:crotonobetainyl-CoA:carnitine CoA-transferase CaiB-like acyl-CoA transferase